MKKVDKTVIRETLFIAMFSALLSGLMNLVFILIKQWDYTVLFGNILGYVAIVLNFFLMGLTVQKSLELDGDEAKKKIKFSQSMRMLMLVAFAAVGAVFDEQFNLITVVVPFLFPRIAIFFRPLFGKDKNDN